MSYITITDWEKHQHYKDRRPTWIKLDIDIIEEFNGDGDEKRFHALPDQAKLTYICLLCLRANYKKKIPFKSEKWLSERLGLQCVDLKSLVSAGYINIDTETVAKAYQDDTVCLPPEKEKEREKEKDTYTLSRIKFVLPDCITQEDWSIFLSHRKSVKAPIAKEAYPAFAEKFITLKEKGFDPHFVVGTIIEKGWRWFKPEWLEEKGNGHQKARSAVDEGLARFLAKEDNE